MFESKEKAAKVWQFIWLWSAKIKLWRAKYSLEEVERQEEQADREVDRIMAERDKVWWRIGDAYPARALRALGLLLADGAPTVGRGKTFWQVSRIFFTETAVTPERKVEKWFPRWEINRHAEG